MKKLFLLMLCLSGFIIFAACKKDVLTAPFHKFSMVSLAADTSYSNTVRTFAANGDTIYTTTLTTVTVVVKKYIAPAAIYASSGPITLQSNKTYSYLTINGIASGMFGGAVSNVHITHCRFTNISGFAINLWNCHDITIDSCYFSNVGFGVFANSNNGSYHIKVNGNQFLNINGINISSLGHAIQFDGVAGGGNQINYNRIENIAGIALHPHDVISVYQSNGIQGDSIQVIGNWIRGGQLTLWPDQYSAACGIGLGDNFGSYQVCRNNILVNPGAAGIQCNGNASSVKIDHNLIYSSGSSITYNAFTVLDPYKIELSFNKTNWTNHNGYNVLLPDGETQYYLGNPASPMPVNMSTNYWKAPINTSILPATIITMK